MLSLNTEFQDAKIFVVKI